MNAPNLTVLTCAVRDNEPQRAGACKWFSGNEESKGPLGLKLMDWRDLCTPLRVSAKKLIFFFFKASSIYPEWMPTVRGKIGGGKKLS